MLDSESFFERTVGSGLLEFRMQFYQLSNKQNCSPVTQYHPCSRTPIRSSIAINQAFCHHSDALQVGKATCLEQTTIAGYRSCDRAGRVKPPQACCRHLSL